LKNLKELQRHFLKRKQYQGKNLTHYLKEYKEIYNIKKHIRASSLKWPPCQGHFKKKDWKIYNFFNILVSWRQYDTKTLVLYLQQILLPVLLI
jgi:hypothetical protein